MALAALLWEIVLLLWSWSNGFVLALTLVAAGLWVTGFYVSVVNRQKRYEWQQAGKDVVVVHCPEPGHFTPNISPFVLKLLTYLRLTRLPYVLDHREPMGAKGKTPWITLNGEDLFDSQLIIQRLARQYDKDFTSRLTKEQRAVATAFMVMTEEHICWCLREWRFNEDGGRTLTEGMPQPFWIRLLMPVFVWQQRNALWHQGIGRHSHANVRDIMKKDLEALSKYLGDKPYLMGEAPCEVDCSMFAFLANILHNYTRSPYYAIVNDELVNLRNYVDRLKNQLWADWNDCLSSA